MSRVTNLRLPLTFVSCFWAVLALPCQAEEKMVLDHATLVIDADQPSFVQYGVQDLAGYLEELTGNKVAIASTASTGEQVNIVVGTKLVGQLFPEVLPEEKLGDEGYVLRTASKDDVKYILLAGEMPRGTKAALGAFMKKIRAEGRSAFVAAPLDIVARPSFVKRGMHFNGWAFNAPYSFRNWREEDWQRYLDILAYQGVNLFYLWPFIEIMPVPLSPEDQAYLEECCRVVDYAQKKHGMEVWIMQCTNRVAQDRCGVADPRLRPYWRPSQKDLNPGDPKDYQAIMDSREAMYRIINNADGVCNIDSDPGQFDGSPLSDYLNVLKGCRAMLDRHNIHGKETKLINWMWTGWGLTEKRFFDRQHQIQTIEGLKKALPEPWGLIAGRLPFLPICREQNVLSKTVILPYGVIEGEPSYPTTNLAIDRICDDFDRNIVKYPETAGVMGNVQTPLLQFPHVFFFTSAMADLDYRKRSEKEVLLDLAEYLYPEQKELIAESYLALKEENSAKIAEIANRLEELVTQNKLGWSGLFGRKLFPDSRIVAQSLVLQLKYRAARQDFVQKMAASPDSITCETLLTDYFDTYLAWDAAHGWHSLWGWKEWFLGGGNTIDNEISLAAREMGRILNNEAAVNRCFEHVDKKLSVKYGNAAVKSGCIDLVKPLVEAGLPNLAQKAKATASMTPDAAKYPPAAAIDGSLTTLYWPGALVQNNTEWIQLTWSEPQRIEKVVVHFLNHRSMYGRTIHLQKEVTPGRWEDFATVVVRRDRSSPHAMATFKLSTPVTLDKIRVVNLLDVFEIEVR